MKTVGSCWNLNSFAFLCAEKPTPVPCPIFTVLTIALEMSSYSVDEGEAVTVCANVVDGSLARNLTFSFSTTMGSATGIH